MCFCICNLLEAFKQQIYSEAVRNSNLHCGIYFSKHFHLLWDYPNSLQVFNIFALSKRASLEESLSSFWLIECKLFHQRNREMYVQQEAPFRISCLFRLLLRKLFSITDPLIYYGLPLHDLNLAQCAEKRESTVPPITAKNRYNVWSLWWRSWRSPASRFGSLQDFHTSKTVAESGWVQSAELLWKDCRS